MKTPASGTDDIDWSLCTYEGAEREQLRVWSRLPLRAKLAAVEEMGELAERFLNDRKARNLPYFDPETGVLLENKPHELRGQS
jgi:hypothetical protein